MKVFKYQKEREYVRSLKQMLDKLGVPHVTHHAPAGTIVEVVLQEYSVYVLQLLTKNKQIEIHVLPQSRRIPGTVQTVSEAQREPTLRQFIRTLAG